MRMSDNASMGITSTGDFGAILVCAVRYALGRHTYMPSLVVDFVKKVIQDVELRSLVVMKKDIEEYLKDEPTDYEDILENWRGLVWSIKKEIMVREVITLNV